MHAPHKKIYNNLTLPRSKNFHNIFFEKHKKFVKENPNFFTLDQANQFSDVFSIIAHFVILSKLAILNHPQTL
jgi:hypothetical protein